MIFALDQKKFLSIVVLVIIATLALLALVDDGESSVEIWGRRSAVMLVVSTLVGIMSIPRVFAFFHWLLLARYWWFPLLDGEWDATIRSNWPRIRKMYHVARDGSAPFDAVSGTLSDEEKKESVTKASVTIKSSLVLFSIELRPANSKRISRTRFVRPCWVKPSLPELSYVYEQFDPEEVAPTDARRHFGAGVVRYDRDKDTIVGEYWTQRREDLGFNTAGTIRMTRRTRRLRGSKAQ